MPVMIPFAISSMVYPAIKEYSPNIVSAEFISENKHTIVTTSAAGVVGAVAGFIGGAFTLTYLVPLVAVGAGILVGAGITEFFTPSVEKDYFPEFITNNDLATSVSKVLMPPMIVSAGSLMYTYKKAAIAYYVASRFSQHFITPHIPGIDSLDSTTKFVIEGAAPLLLMGSGCGLLQIPVVATTAAQFGNIYTYASRGLTGVSMAYNVVDSINSAYIQHHTLSQNVCVTSVVLFGGYHLSKLPFVLGVSNAVNNFVNIDEVVLMTVLNSINERLIEKTGDPMLDTLNSDVSSTVKTAIAAAAGLKKGATPYTRTKVIAAALKPAIKFSPVGLNNADIISNSTNSYGRVVATYMADLPATWVASAEKTMFRTTETLLKETVSPQEAKRSMFDNVQSLVDSKKLTSDNANKISFSTSLSDTDVVISSVSSSCFKTVATSLGARGTKIWQTSFVVPSLKRLDIELKQYCSGTVSDFCTYVTVYALPKCVKQYLAYQINLKASLELSDTVRNAIQDSVTDLEYLEKNGEDKFCGFLDHAAIKNEGGLDIERRSEMKNQDISDKFLRSLSLEDQANLQASYVQFASIVEFAKGVTLSLCLIDYFISFASFSRNSKYLPSLSIEETLLLGKADHIIYNKEIGNTYIFAGSVRAITTVMEDFYLPYVGVTRFSAPLKILPVAGGVYYLGNEVSEKFDKISAKERAKVGLASKEKVFEKAKSLLHKDWQDLYKSHKDGFFDKNRVAAYDPEGVVQSSHRCNQFMGLVDGLDIAKTNGSVGQIIKEVRAGCKHVQEAFDSLNHIPKATYSDALRKFDPVFKNYCDHFDKQTVEIDSLISIRDACQIVSHLEKPQGQTKCVCDNINSLINDLMQAGEELRHEIAGQAFSAHSNNTIGLL